MTQQFTCRTNIMYRISDTESEVICQYKFTDAMGRSLGNVLMFLLFLFRIELFRVKFISDFEKIYQTQRKYNEK